MANSIITFDISNDELRDDLDDFLIEIRMIQEHSNQSTYYGTLSKHSLKQISDKIRSCKDYFKQGDYFTVYSASDNNLNKTVYVADGNIRE